MDIIHTNNSGLIVVTLDECLPTSGEQSEDSAMKAECLYTVAVMAPEGVLVPTSEASCLQQPTEQISEVADISHSQDCREPNEAPIIPNAEQDEDYYSHIICYLTTQTFPEGISDARRTMISRRARHYHIMEGQLYYGQKHPKKVICEEESKNNVMKSIHVLKSTGVHIGVQKMYLQLKKDYFWCGMYMDIIKFVRQCNICIDSDLPLTSAKTLANKARKASSPKYIQHVSCDKNNSDRTAARHRSEVWKQVELRLSGPFSEDRFLLSIADPYSQWLEVRVVTQPDLGGQAADFLVNTFCQLGFTSFSAVGFSPDLLASLQHNYQQKFNHLTSGFNNKESTTKKLADCSEDKVLCPWINELLTSYMDKFPETWATQLPQLLFNFRSTPLYKNEELSPFNVMFQRDPVSLSIGENKENCRVRYSKRLQGSELKRIRQKQNIATRKITCTSKVLQLHRQSRKKVATLTKVDIDSSEDEDDPDKVCNERMETEVREESVCGTGSSSTHTQSPEIREVCASTVAAVQALLTATRKERSRRGQYQRYTTELREQIASYALQHGSLAAVKYFSNELNTAVSESTIRNFIKDFQTFSPELQEQIGAYAISHNIDVTVQHFSSLGYDIRSSLVRKFKKIHMSKFPMEKNFLKISSSSSTGKKKKIYNTSLREEIGQYAVQFGVPATVKHFSQKLQISVKETTVKKFEKSHQEKKNIFPSVSQQTLPIISQTETLPTETMDVVQASFSVLNSSPSAHTLVYNHQPYQPLMSPISFHQNHTLEQTTAFQQQSLPSVLSHNSQLVFSQASFQPHTTYTNTFTQLQTSNIHMASPSAETSQILSAANEHNSTMNQCNNTQMILSQHPILITHSQSQGDNNMTLHLDNLTTLPAFEAQISSQNDSTTTINFLQPPSISFEPSTISTNEIVHQNQQNSNNPTNFSPVGIMENSSAQLIRVISVNCENTPNLKIVPDIICNQEANTVINKETSEKSPSTSAATIFKISKPKSVKANQSKLKAKCKKNKKNKNRGNYTTYSPEIRAELGRYAASHGNQQAIIHFRETLGHDVPESTVRGLKEKYLAKMELSGSNDGIESEKPVTSIGFALRGRPMRLGKYDEIVRQCIRDLVSNGERVSSFLAIATAKQVLTENEPSLLAENGGSIKLTTNWAKSFLKRIGIHNNS